MSEESGRATRWLRAAEQAGGDGPAWAMLLAAWILGRNLLEGVLERPHTLGFDGREDLSAAMVFLHFPVFYLVVFAWTCVLLQALSRRPLAGVLRATSLGFGVLLVAPVVDAVASRGAGYDLAYLRTLGPFLLRFWNPAESLTEVSPGQRVEIVLACLLAGSYAFLGRRAQQRESALGHSSVAAGPNASVLRPGIVAVLAGAGVFALSAISGAWPTLLAWLGHRQYPRPGSAYWDTFRMGGLIPDESRRHALAMLLPLLPAIVLLAARRDPERFRLALRAIPWSRLLFYAGLLPAGAWIGYLVCRESLPARFPGPTDWAAMVVLSASMVAAFLAAVSWNDLYDREADQVNAPARPVASGAIPPESVHRAAIVFGAGALFLALCVAYPAALLILAVLLLSWAYSAPPLRLKRYPGIATAVLGSLAVLSISTGFSLFTREAVPRSFPPAVALALWVGVTLGFTAKDLKDSAGDRRTGTVTLATMLGAPWDRRITAGLVALSFALAPAMLRLGPWFIWLSLAFAAGGAVWTMRVRRPDTGLLLGFCVFAGVLLAMLGRDPASWQRGAAAEAARNQSTLLACEQESRELWRDEQAGRTVDPVTGETNDVRRARCLETLSRLPLDRWPKFRVAGPSEREQRTLLATARVLSPESAREIAGSLTGQRPLRTEYYEARLEAQIAIGDPREMIQVCDRAIAMGIDPERFLRNRAAAWLGLRETAMAKEDIRRLRARAGDDIQVRVLEGDLLLQSGDPSGALAVYARTERLDPQNADLWAGRGQASHALGKLNDAVASLTRATELRPDDAWYRNNLGVALRDAGRDAEAHGAFEEAARLAPGLYEPHLNLGLLDEKAGKLDEARRHLAAARRLAMGFPPLEAAWRRLGGGAD